MDLQLKNKVTVITGPAKGMGRAISLAFAKEGAQLVLRGETSPPLSQWHKRPVRSVWLCTWCPAT